MTARPVFVKLAAFFFAFAAAVALAALLTPAPPRRAIPRAGVARPAFAIADNLDADVQLVTLDRESRRSYTRLNLWLVGASLPPERLWVRTYFFSPSAAARGYWAGDVVELVRPFGDDGGRASVTVSAPCGWCDGDGVPAGGYFARVQILDDSGEAMLPSGLLFGDIKTAVPVVVHAEHVPLRRR